MESNAFVARFWGARGSYPVPGPSTLHYGGNTTCVELQVGKHTIVLDAGTGIINLGHNLLQRAKQNGGTPIIATILLTHMHHDHTQGFPYFLPAYIGTSVLHILGPRTFEEELEESLNHAVLPPSFPVGLNEMPSFKVVRSLRETDTVILDQSRGDLRIYNTYHDHIEHTPDMVQVRILKSYAHPRNGVFIYRVEWHGKSVVFASDTEGYIDTDQRLVNFARDTDLLIHDAQYSQHDYATSKQGWGHSTPQMACDVARLCSAKRLVLFHHEPLYNDEMIASLEQEAQQLFSNTVAAYEGLEIEL